MKKLRVILISILSIVLIAFIAFLMIAPAQVEKGMNVVDRSQTWPVSDEAKSLHASLLIGDWHTDSLLWDRDLLKEESYGHVDIPRLQQGNVALQVFTAVTKSPKGQNYESNTEDASDNITPLVMAQLWPTRTWNSLFERALYQVERLHRIEQAAPKQLLVIENQQDLSTLLQKRKNGSDIVGALMGMEGAHPLEGKLENLQKLYDAGYRLVGLQHFFDNELGGSLHGRSGAGLTEFGEQVVEFANQHNMIIDVAHSSQQVVKDVLQLAKRPIVVSHTGIHSHCETQRNLPDALMKKIAEHGGVIGIGYWADVTCDDSPAGIVKTIQSAVALLDEDHVSLGSDYDGTIKTRFDTSELAVLTHELLRHGFTEKQIRKIMGENMLRVLRANL